ncbi:hypothetical protein AB1I63_01405 [Streptococcus pneumoniae]
MNAQGIYSFNQITLTNLESVSGGYVPPGYYSPFSHISDNIICKIGTSFSLRNGNCIVNYGNIVANVANNMAASLGDLHNPLP